MEDAPVRGRLARSSRYLATPVFRRFGAFSPEFGRSGALASNQFVRSAASLLPVLLIRCTHILLLLCMLVCNVGSLPLYVHSFACLPIHMFPARLPDFVCVCLLVCLSRLLSLQLVAIRHSISQ